MSSLPKSSDGTQALRLEIQGLGVPSFKNSKMLTRGRLITDPRKREVMDKITDAFESQLRSALATTGEGTRTGRLVRSLTVCATEFDDSVQWIPEIHVYVERVAKGHEGAVITIEETPCLPTKTKS